MNNIWRVWIKGTNDFYDYVAGGPYYAAKKHFHRYGIREDDIICVENTLSHTLAILDNRPEKENIHKAEEYTKDYPVFEYDYRHLLKPQ